LLLADDVTRWRAPLPAIIIWLAADAAAAILMPLILPIITLQIRQLLADTAAITLYFASWLLLPADAASCHAVTPLLRQLPLPMPMLRRLPLSFRYAAIISPLRLRHYHYAAADALAACHIYWFFRRFSPCPAACFHCRHAAATVITPSLTFAVSPRLRHEGRFFAGWWSVCFSLLRHSHFFQYLGWLRRFRWLPPYCHITFFASCRHYAAAATPLIFTVISCCRWRWIRGCHRFATPLVAITLSILRRRRHVCRRFSPLPAIFRWY